ncbi:MULTISPECIES: hypothetical protein [unclassified Clostridium]|uniref:hypothetical protein n=1 Tax=unclassified Clostridium TaxID=2614128 RepID=UPI0020795A20|nr:MULTISPECIES: hypothetical protein [unclassified Clostridium]
MGRNNVFLDNNEVKEILDLIDKYNCSNSKNGVLEGIYIDDNIIFDNHNLTKMSILFDNITISHINPNIYINTIYKNIDFDEIEKKFKNHNIKFIKTFSGAVDNYNFAIFIKKNKLLIKEKTLIPEVLHKLPINTPYEDNEILLKFISGNNRDSILNLSKYFNIIREKDTFCVDDPLFYLLKLIKINYSFIKGLINGSIPISEKTTILNYVMMKNRNEKIMALNPKELKFENIDLKDKMKNNYISNLAVETFNLLVPNFPVLKPEEILEVRYKMRNELGAYRLFIKDLMIKYSNNNELNNTEIIQKEIIKNINDINLKILSEKSKLFRKIISYGTIIPTVGSYLSGGDTKRIIASCFAGAIKITCDVNEYCDNKNQILKTSTNLPFAFLINAKKVK